MATRRDRSRTWLARALGLGALCVAIVVPAASSGPADEAAVDRWDLAPAPTAVLGFRDAASLRRALARFPGRVVRTIPALGVAEVLPRARPRHFANAVSQIDGIDFAEPPVRRVSAAEPALLASPSGTVFEWQYAATRANAVPASIHRAASNITLAVVDTGADLTAPDIAAKRAVTRSVVSGGTDVRDAVGHGTFVTALAAGSVSNDEGMAGFSGDAKLIVVQASRAEGAFSDIDEAAAIVWAVDRGARIVNLSLGGPDTSSTERAAIAYAAQRGALLVAASGNEHEQGNPVEYPAALLQPVGSSGRGGVGLSVGASDQGGARASFSNSGSHLSLVAPGVAVFSALSASAENAGYVPTPLPGSREGSYGYGSGTSFAVPQVAGAAALVWAANPGLAAQDVAEILKQTASNRGVWNSETGYGVLDVATAVERASNGTAIPAAVTLEGKRLDPRRIRLDWRGRGAASYRLSVRDGQGEVSLLEPSTTRTSTIFRGTPGGSYVFTVDALDVLGNSAATSKPVELALPPARAQVVLRASRTVGRSPLRVVFRASLVPAEEGVAREGRELVLESLDAGRWLPAANAWTRASGEVSWSLTLDERGVYRLRVRLKGDAELNAALSRPVSLTVS